jgi:hypothetical protein
MVTVDNVLELANQLTDEQQEILIDIFQKRMIARRRREIAQDAQKSIAEFRSGKLKSMTAEEAIADLREYLNSDLEE